MKYSVLPAIILSTLLVAGCSKKNEFQPPPPPEVVVMNPVQQTVTTYESFPGRVAARTTVDIRARVKGFLKSIEFSDGQQVEQGDLLFTIEPEQYASAVKAAEAELAQAHAALKLAEATLQRTTTAFKAKAVSEVDLLTAEAGKQSAEGVVIAAEAALENARLNLSYTKIHAPISGRIASSTLSAGNLVGDSGSTILTTLVAESPVDVFFNVSERALLPYLNKGMRNNKPGSQVPPVKLELASGEKHGEDGIIDYTDPALDPETGTLKARAAFPNKEKKLVPGLYGKILIPQQVEGALLVPDMLVQRDMSGYYVLTVNAQNLVESKYIKRGAVVGGNRIITNGLDIGDRVIAKGIQRARPGIPVRIAAPKAAE
jgi:RND family efflux transporter MFP subunit